MKIKKYGKVIITEDDILVTDFHFDGEGGEGDQRSAYLQALYWAIARIENVRNTQGDHQTLIITP